MLNEGRVPNSTFTIRNFNIQHSSFFDQSLNLSYEPSPGARRVLPLSRRGRGVLSEAKRGEGSRGLRRCFSRHFVPGFRSRAPARGAVEVVMNDVHVEEGHGILSEAMDLVLRCSILFKRPFASLRMTCLSSLLLFGRFISSTSRFFRALTPARWRSPPLSLRERGTEG